MKRFALDLLLFCRLAVFLAFNLCAGLEIQLNDLQVPTRIINEVEYAPLLELVSAAGGNTWQVENKFIVLLPPRGNYACEIVFTLGQEQVIVNQQVITLPVPFRLLDNEIYVPTAFLNQLFPVQLARMPQLLSLSLSHLRDTSVLRLETDTEAYYSWVAVTSSRFRIYLQADCRIRQMEPTGLIKKLELNQRNGTELTVGTTQPCYCRITREGAGLVVRLTPRPARRIGTIVIDPGHGGKDPGAVGKTLKEKDVNLDIAQRLSRRLKQATKAKVVLLRERDEFLTLSERTHVANKLSADLFISIHCNAAPESPKAHGFETWFLSPARTDWERAVMSRENSALDFEVQDTNPSRGELVSSILRDLAQNEFLRESEELAAAVQSAASTWLRGRDRGVKQADFAVLRNAYMPAVLIECGFLTNSDEEKLLAATDYRERIATAVTSGIAQFINRVETRSRRQQGSVESRIPE